MRNFNVGRWSVIASLGLAGVFSGGCTPDEQHRDIPVPQVKVVTAYGLTLDDKATPQQVAYVLLRSIADDVHAAQSHKRDEQKKATTLTHSLLAFPTIEQRLVNAENMTRAQKETTLGKDRDEKLWDFSRYLAPIVAHYVPSFDTDFESAVGKMRLIGTLEASVLHVYYQAAHAPAASDLQERDPVIVDIELVKEIVDGKGYWRVAKIGFAGRGASFPTTRISLPAAVPATSQPSASAPAR